MVVTRADVDEICMHYTCGRCGAVPGRWCITTRGLPAQLLHVSRFTQAVETGELPLPG